MQTKEHYISLNKLIWKDVKSLSEQAPNLVRLVNSYSDKADELEEYFTNKYLTAQSDSERKSILRAIEKT